MGRHLTVATIIEINRISSDVAFVELIEIDVKDNEGVVVETIRICRNNENLTFGGDIYFAADFTINISQKAGEETSVSLSAFDPTGVLLSKMEEYEGGVGSDVRLHIVNTARLDDPPEISEEFEIIGASTKGYQVTIQLGAENPLRRRFPMGQQYRNRCRHTYKGTRCKYAGGITTCDYSFDGANGCKVHANEVNFGGYRGLGGL